MRTGCERAARGPVRRSCWRAAFVRKAWLYFVNLHYFVAVVVDDFDGNLAGLGLVKGAADGGIQGLPGRFVYVGPERPFEFFIGVAGPGEIGVADEEALAVVISVNEPAGDVVGATVADLAGGRIVDVHAFDLGDELALAPGPSPIGWARGTLFAGH